MFCLLAYRVCIAVCLHAALVGLTVHCMCASCLCASLCAAGNSKTRPYRPPRGLKAQGVPKQHGLNKKKKKAFQKPRRGKKRRRICTFIHSHTHTHTHTQWHVSHLTNPWLKLCSESNIKHLIIHTSKYIFHSLINIHVSSSFSPPPDWACGRPFPYRLGLPQLTAPEQWAADLVTIDPV